MGVFFEWDRRKETTIRRKHGVSFDEAATVFSDTCSITIPDPDHSENEDRLILLGFCFKGNLLVVVHTDQNDKIRIISARRASRKEAHQYGEDQKR